MKITSRQSWLGLGIRVTVLLLLCLGTKLFAQPVITSQPTNIVTSGWAVVQFRVTATGTPDLAYSWWFSGSNAPVSSSPTYTISGVQSYHAGSYYVVVSNAEGAVTSSVVTLRFMVTNPIPPSITLQPFSKTVPEGNTFSFSSGFKGASPLSFQWWFNGAPLVGETGSTFSRAAAATNHAGTYFVVISNPYGEVISSNATLTVTQMPPSITSQPTNLTVNLEGSAKFAVGFYGAKPMFFQWFNDAGPLAGASDSVLNLANVSSNQAGGYHCVASNAYGTATSSVATLTVVWKTAPYITNQPVSITTNFGATVRFAVGAGGTTPLTYRWRSDLSSSVIGTNATLTLTGVTPKDNGKYYVAVSNAYGEVLSSVATLKVLSDAPFIITEPVDVTVDESSPAQFTVTATGAQPLYYTWWFRYASGPVGTASNLNFSSAGTNDAGAYYVVVSNAYGVVQSRVTFLTVNPVPHIPPTITNQPVSVTINESSSASFSVRATGSQPLSYLWWFSGSNSPVGTSSNLFVSGKTSNAGDYYATVSNAYGAVTSSIASLTVRSGLPVITSQPADVATNAGSEVLFRITVAGTQPFSYQWWFTGSKYPLGSDGPVSESATFRATTRAAIILW